MEETYCLDLLTQREIKPTAIRLLVLKAMLKAGRPVALADLEAMLDTVDRSTLFRTVTLFLARHLVHSIDDGTGSLKYALCDRSCTCAVEDLHTHFHCQCCNKTFCFTHTPIPMVPLPQGFTLSSINYVLKGLCPECTAREKKASHS